MAYNEGDVEKASLVIKNKTYENKNMEEHDDTDEIVIVDGTKSSSGEGTEVSFSNKETSKGVDAPVKEKKSTDFKLLIPDGEFTRDDIVKMNEHQGTSATVYIKLLGAIQFGVVELARKEKIPGRPGRPTNVYRKIGN